MKRHSVPRHLGERYVREYTKGWRAWPEAQRRGSGEVAAFANATGSRAFEDGYYDYSADREKWHLAYCTAHHNDEGGCGRA